MTTTDRQPDPKILAHLKKFPWPDGWAPRLTELERWVAGQPVGPDAELVAEVGPGHLLYGYAGQAIPIADRDGRSDDYVYFLPKGPAPFAVVHLTWSGKQDRYPEFPSTELISSVEALHQFLGKHSGGI